MSSTPIHPASPTRRTSPRIQNRRHPIVHLSHQLIRTRCDQRECLQHRSIRLLPRVAQARESKRFIAAYFEKERLLELLLPFIESICRNNAPPARQNRAITRALGQCFSARIDSCRKTGIRFAPRRHQSPTHRLQFALLRNDRRTILPRSDIVARREIGLLQRRVKFSIELRRQPIRISSPGIPPTHACNVETSSPTCNCDAQTPCARRFSVA